MTPGRLLCIVEGEGELKALPILVQRMLKHLRREQWLQVDSERIICTKNGDRITAPYHAPRQLGIEYFVGIAARHKPAAILVVVDGEDRCRMRQEASLPSLGPELLARGQSVAGDIPLEVVVANRMFESWFLADFHSLRARKYFLPDADFPDWRTPEEVAGCKEWMRRLMGKSYSPKIDQGTFAQGVRLPLRQAIKQRSPSLHILLKRVDSLSQRVRARTLAQR